MRRLSPPSRGFTLIELVVGVAIAVFLALTAAPYLNDYMANSRLREGGNILFAEALAAQGEAIKRNAVVRLSTDGGTVQVIDRSVPSTPVVLRERLLTLNVSATSATVDFGSEGRPLPFPTTASVDLSLAGQSCSDDIRCPGLRIEAGGAIRLCGNYTLTSC